MPIKYLVRPIIFVITICASFVFSQSVWAIANPATAYCRGLGYEWQVEKTPAGEIGICKMPDNSTCEEWNFLTGKCGKDHSYCAEKGYQLKTITDGRKCASAFSRECAVCVLKDGVEIEVLALMTENKEIPSLAEEGALIPLPQLTCGNGVCGANENYQNCPEDCPAPPVGKGLAFYIGIGLLISAAIIGLIYYYFRRKRKML